MVLFLHLLLKFAQKMFILHFFVATLVQKWHFSMKSTEKSFMGGQFFQNWPSHETCIIIITTRMNFRKTNTVDWPNEFLAGVRPSSLQYFWWFSRKMIFSNLLTSPAHMKYITMICFARLSSNSYQCHIKGIHHCNQNPGHLVISHRQLLILWSSNSKILDQK